MPTFEWTEQNIEHLARHGITPAEVEEVFEGGLIRRRGGTGRPDRIRILGRTAGGRYLALVVQEKEENVTRPFTGRGMRRHERQLYDRQVKD